LQESGVSHIRKFEEALKQTGVFLSNEDVKNLQASYGDSQG